MNNCFLKLSFNLKGMKVSLLYVFIAIKSSVPEARLRYSEMSVALGPFVSQSAHEFGGRPVNDSLNITMPLL